MNTIVRPAAVKDWLYVESLRRAEGSSLGFVPKERYLSVIERRSASGRNDYLFEAVFVAEDDGDTTGYCYARLGSLYAPAKVYQVAVQKDARRWERASLLVGAVESAAGLRGAAFVRARVAVDLEANLFWRACGYRQVGESSGTFLARSAAKSERPIAVYEKAIRSVQKSLFSALEVTDG